MPDINPSNAMELIRQSALRKRQQEDLIKNEISGNYPEPDPKGAMQLALLHLQTLHPELASNIHSVSSMNWLDRLVATRNTRAQTSPFRNITYAPEQVNLNQSTNDDVMAHEAIHAQQFKKSGFLGSLLDRSDIETPAYDEMRRRRAARQDIELSSMRKK